MIAVHILSFDPASIHMGYMLYDIAKKKIIKWGKITIKDSTNYGSCKKMIMEFEKLEFNNLKEPTLILHEQQPRCNIKTITICGQIQMYFSINSKNVTKVVGYHAKNKINYYKFDKDEEPMPKKITDLKKGYYKTKQTLVEHCRRILKKTDPEWLDWFEKQKKKDDISDAYIQALSYLKI